MNTVKKQGSQKLIAEKFPKSRKLLNPLLKLNNKKTVHLKEDKNSEEIDDVGPGKYEIPELIGHFSNIILKPNSPSFSFRKEKYKVNAKAIKNMSPSIYSYEPKEENRRPKSPTFSIPKSDRFHTLKGEDLRKYPIMHGEILSYLSRIKGIIPKGERFPKDYISKSPSPIDYNSDNFSIKYHLESQIAHSSKLSKSTKQIRFKHIIPNEFVPGPGKYDNNKLLYKMNSQILIFPKAPRFPKRKEFNIPELGRYNTQDPKILSTNIQPISYSFGKDKKRLNDKRLFQNIKFYAKQNLDSRKMF